MNKWIKIILRFFKHPMLFEVLPRSFILLIMIISFEHVALITKTNIDMWQIKLMYIILWMWSIKPFFEHMTELLEIKEFNKTLEENKNDYSSRL